MIDYQDTTNVDQKGTTHLEEEEKKSDRLTVDQASP
jgi:hypothetical protein